MYTPALDYPIVQKMAFDPMVKDVAEPVKPIVCENITPDAVFDQVETYNQLVSYDALMGEYARSSSEVELEAARLIVMGEDWQIAFNHDDPYVFVIRDRKTWGKLDIQDVTVDLHLAASKGDTALAYFYQGLLDQMDDAHYDRRAETYNERIIWELTHTHR